MKKETSYQKLKRELKESEEKYSALYNDFRKYVKGDTMTVITYNTSFSMADSFEKMIWSGSSNA